MTIKGFLLDLQALLRAFSRWRTVMEPGGHSRKSAEAGRSA
jgi:hypothetical protein